MPPAIETDQGNSKITNPEEQAEQHCLVADRCHHQCAAIALLHDVRSDNPQRIALLIAQRRHRHTRARNRLVGGRSWKGSRLVGPAA